MDYFGGRVNANRVNLGQIIKLNIKKTFLQFYKLFGNLFIQKSFIPNNGCRSILPNKFSFLL